MIMLIKWPESLPCLRIGSTFEAINPMMITKLQNGRKRYRRNFTATPVDYDAKWNFTDEQAARFIEFYQHDLVDGSEWFEMPLVVPFKGMVDCKVHFEGGYSYEIIGAAHSKKTTGRKWEFKAKMSIYLRPEYEPS